MKEKQRVELMFEGETVIAECNKTNSKKLIRYLKEDSGCAVLFPDYEDE